MKKIKRIILSGAFLTITGTTAIYAQTQDSATTGDSATSQDSGSAATQQPAAATGNVIQAISQSGYNTILAGAIKTAGLESTLEDSGPYTVFAPSDQAFTNGSKADSLLKDPAKLAPVLRNQIVKGQYTKADIIKALTAGKGVATLTTIDGGTLTLKVNANKNLELSDTAGNTALVTVFDLQGTNGVAHVINNVLLAQ